MKFSPFTDVTVVSVPYIEDARADCAPGYATGKSEAALQSEISGAIAQLGGGATVFVAGVFEDEKRRKRYGYEVRFALGANPALIRVAGLPMRKETAAKRRQVQIQALFVVRDWLRAAVTSRVFTPGFSPLLQFMLVPGTQRTVDEYMIQAGNLPDLNPALPAPVLQGEIVG